MRAFSVMVTFAAFCFACVVPAMGLFVAAWEGVTTVTAEKAPIRKEEGWGEEPIIYLVKRGEKLKVLDEHGHGNGSWLTIEVTSGEKLVRGSIDVRETSFWDDVQAGRIKQPSGTR